MDDLQETVSQINEPESEGGFSRVFVETSRGLAQKLSVCASVEDTEESIQWLAKILASYED